MPSKARLVCVPPESIADVWPYVEGLLAGATNRTGLADLRVIERDLKSGAALLWVAIDGGILAAATTSICQVNGSRICELTACGGKERGRWLDLLEQIELYAKAEGCTSMRIYGRKGWQRVLKNYDQTNIILERRL